MNLQKRGRLGNAQFLSHTVFTLVSTTDPVGNPKARHPADEPSQLIEQVESLRNDMLRLAEDSADLLQHTHAHHRLSAQNLLHYLALRSRDLRLLQTRLAAAGLSSLGRAESHVLAAVEAALYVLRCL